jgi:hypothetical protein
MIAFEKGFFAGSYAHAIITGKNIKGTTVHDAWHATVFPYLINIKINAQHLMLLPEKPEEHSS